ncbi:MAG: seryl-tRNA synthetase [Acidimicrobiaceae bacterium]|jgi:seryl-tRNA synthetase|nr:seryl-tRNA synthetase [Acidimicrobiaceae bacterium]
MIDIRSLRTDFEATKAALARKKVGPADVDRAMALDGRLRDLATQRDELRAQVNALSKQVGQARRDGDAATGDQLMADSRRLGDEESKLADEAAAVEADLRDLLLRIPNVPSDSAPDGDTDADNPVLRIQNYAPERFGDHQRIPHWEIGAALGILDLERAVKISGSMFSMFRGPGATLARALCQLALDRNADAFEEVRPPTLVTSATLTATGQLPKFADDAYHIERDDLWAVPTAEVPLTSLARDEILDEADLPTRLMAYTPCYRREAGSAGRDTRGLLRVHEFDKVEILAYTTPEQAPAMLDELVARAEGTIDALGLAYRVIEICVGDLGQSHHRSYDIEVYAPGCDMWLEVSSVSWFSDYQARRANIRYRPSEGKGTALVHTLNGSALAVPRVWAALVETYRRDDGSVVVPDALRPYFRGMERIEAR